MNLQEVINILVVCSLMSMLFGFSFGILAYWLPKTIK